jgi:hypothetical protein
VAVLDGLTPFVLEKFFPGFYYTANPTLPQPAAALYPSKDFSVDRGLLQKRPGDALFQPTAQVLSGRLQKAFDWVDPTGVRHVFVITTTNLYHFNTGTNLFDSFLSGLLGTLTIIPQATSFFGKLLIVNGGNGVIRTDGTLAGTSIIAGSPVGARSIISLGGRAMTAYIGNLPTKIQWCNSLDETNWTTGSSGTNTLDRDDDAIQRMVIFRSQALIVRRKSVWTGTPLDVTPYYDFQGLSEGIGTYAPDSVQVYPLGILFLGDDNVYGLGGTAPEPIGLGAREFIQGINLTNAPRIVSTINLTQGRYYLAVPFSASTDPVDVLVYNYQEGHYAYWGKPGLTGLGSTYFSQPITWASLTSPWSTYTMTWAELGSTATQHQTLYLKSDGTVYQEGPGRHDVLSGVSSAFTTTYKTPLFPIAPKQEGADPTPAVVEFVQLDCQPNPSTLTVQLGWSRAAGTPTTVSTARTVAVPTSGVRSGGVLLGFDTREAPYWQLTITDANIDENPQVMRAILWHRRRATKIRG